MPRLALRLGSATLLGALAALTFAAYLEPDFAFAVASRVWGCF
ncbi:MAG: hypothetical protein ACOVOT_15155 [Rubrivivax sp.]|jgi:hypothetical protein